MTSTMTVGEVVVAALGRLGVDHAFGVVSVHNMPMLDALVAVDMHALGPFPTAALPPHLRPKE